MLEMTKIISLENLAHDVAEEIKFVVKFFVTY
jgi:hypothetical protein